MINENLKQIYTKMYNELKKDGNDLDDIYCEIEDHCSYDAELWDLSSDVDGGVHQSYCNSMREYITSLSKN
jgi:hypothetical protein